MSKKESEFDRYERMKKLEREAEMVKRKESGGKKKSGRPKTNMFGGGSKNWSVDYDDMFDEFDVSAY